MTKRERQYTDWGMKKVFDLKKKMWRTDYRFWIFIIHKFEVMKKGSKYKVEKTYRISIA